MSEVLKAKYAQLCQSLGDLSYRKSQIELEIKQIESEIYGLNYVNSILQLPSPRPPVQDCL